MERKSYLSVSETRNSRLRELSAGLIETVTGRIHQTFPYLTPDHITLFGSVGTAVGSALAMGGNQALTLATLGLANLSDAFDGALARTIERELPGSIDFKSGAIKDALSDRFQELFMAISRAVTAHRRVDKIGSLVALSAALTNSLPSTARAFAESRGIAVPESGRGAMGILGTRVGRGSLGVAATAFPEIKGVPVQIVADILVTIANLAAAIDRAKRINGASPALSRETQADAQTRLKALMVFTGLALGATAITYLILKKGGGQKSTEASVLPQTEDERYVQILAGIENYCSQNNLNHRFVGGTLTDLIGPQTEFEIDAAGKTIRLKGSNPQIMMRGDGTVKDVDLVIFSNNRQTYIEARNTFAAWARTAKAENIPFPQISVEAAYHPGWPKRNRLKQFVSAFEVDGKGHLALTFGNVRQQIPHESIEPWTVILENGTRLTTFNPVAHRLCYQLRVPSGIKPKDRNKMPTLLEFAQKTIAAGLVLGINYVTMYQPWITYIDKLQNHPDPLTKVKGTATKLYWETLGTQVSHGAGPLGRLSRLSDKLSG